MRGTERRRFGLLGVLTLTLFRPRRNDADFAGISDGLPEMFAIVAGDQEESSADGGLSARRFDLFVEIGVLDIENRSPKMRERIFQGRQHLALSAE